MVTTKKILVPTDYSECSLVAARYAIEFATTLKASVDVVHIWSAPFFGPDYDDSIAAEGHKSLYQLVRERAAAEMGEFLAKLNVPESLKLTSHVESGEPTHAILELIADRSVDLVVMGTHGHTGPKYWVVGSVATRIVQLSPRPVLTVPARSHK